jgi:osmotically inducible lipoprotein OsmB
MAVERWTFGLRRPAVFTSPHLMESVMKKSIRMATCWSAVVLVASLSLGGCAGMSRQEKGTATGAVIGGVAGNVVGGGILGTAAGAAVGGVIGHEVTK